ncbi:hypothetical protein ACWEN6_14020 [Sphaerisporangium sp. NPDC004334]
MLTFIRQRPQQLALVDSDQQDKPLQTHTWPIPVIVADRVMAALNQALRSGAAHGPCGYEAPACLSYAHLTYATNRDAVTVSRRDFAPTLAVQGINPHRLTVSIAAALQEAFTLGQSHPFAPPLPDDPTWDDLIEGDEIVRHKKGVTWTWRIAGSERPPAVIGGVQGCVLVLIQTKHDDRPLGRPDWTVVNPARSVRTSMSTAEKVEFIPSPARRTA